jgi:hypothetical protein
MSGEGKQPAALGPGLAPFLDSTRIGAGLPQPRHLAVVGDDLPVSAAGLCCNPSFPDGETRHQKVGSLRCAFLASPLVHSFGHHSHHRQQYRRWCPIAPVAPDFQFSGLQSQLPIQSLFSFGGILFLLPMGIAAQIRRSGTLRSRQCGPLRCEDFVVRSFRSRKCRNWLGPSASGYGISETFSLHISALRIPVEYNQSRTARVG